MTPTPAPSPSLDVQVLNPVCDGDVPYLQYSVRAFNAAPGADTVTITWVNPSGASVVQANLPLVGRVPWPGAVAGADGKGIDWPGWLFVNGEWVQGDDGFQWVRPQVTVNFEVNPSATRVVSYPPSSPDCNTNPPGKKPSAPPAARAAASDTSGGLPHTGAALAVEVGAAAALVAAGAGMVVVTRRRRGSHA